MKALLGTKQLLYIMLMAIIATVFGAIFLHNANPLTTSNSFYVKVLFVNIGFMGDALFAFLCVGYLYFILQKKALAIQLLLQTLVLLLFVQLVNNFSSNNSFSIFWETNAIDNVVNKNIQPFTVSSHTGIAVLLFMLIVTATKNKFKVWGALLITAMIIVSRYYYFQNNGFAILLGSIIAIVSYTGIKLLLANVKLLRNPIENNVQPNTQPLYSI
ncbi:hypothetical protein ACFOWM_10235 [Ferruginibacter yonginensis]|uniref:PAP2 superfamily protein n=1 Tax=Ferruginibacter yonginensis TaxID=1310416 RepID=A0ABV8QU26_9BACT